MKIIAKVVALSLLTLALTSFDSSLAQRKPANKTGAPKPSPTPTASPEKSIDQKPIEPLYSRLPFDPTLTSLPPNFRGHGAIEIYQSLDQRAKASAKSEFETTEAYNQRLKAEISKPLLGSLTQDSAFAFVIAGLESQYDADQRILHVRASLPRDLRDRVSFRWATVETENSSYIATNAYGAQTTVKRRRGDFYDILLGDYQRFSTTTYLDKAAETLSEEDRKRYPELFESMKRTAFFTDLEMDAETAMKAKTNLRMLLICQLTAPYASEADDLDTFSTPTLKEPYDYRFTKHMLHTNPLQIWFFDLASGRLFAKQEPR